MKYEEYNVEDFIRDEYFQLWVWGKDSMAEKFWEQWSKEHPLKREVVEEAKNFLLLMDTDGTELSDDKFDLMWRNIIEQRVKKECPKENYPRKRAYPFLIKYAAVFLGLVSLGTGLYFSKIFTFVDTQQMVTKDAITLELEDGTITILEDTAVKTISERPNGASIEQNNRTLYYAHREVPEKLVFNHLRVPYGKKFELLLSDGSHVFLNAGTRIRYPVSFLPGRPRDVYLDGEAYFDIQKDSLRAFTVITDDMNTRVFGTSFNVSSYKNDGNTSTVLVEGSVGVYRPNSTEGREPLLIEPGQRALFVDDVMKIMDVDVRKYRAWTEGKLFFVDDRFDIVLKELQRHFNVKIDNSYDYLNEIKFTGTFEDESLDQILNVFREHTAFHYEINDNKIQIYE